MAALEQRLHTSDGTIKKLFCKGQFPLNPIYRSETRQRLSENDRGLVACGSLLGHGQTFLEIVCRLIQFAGRAVQYSKTIDYNLGIRRYTPFRLLESFFERGFRLRISSRPV